MTNASDRRQRGYPFVTVLAAKDQGLLAVAGCLLDGARIRYFMRDVFVQDIIAPGRIGWNTAIGPTRVEVRPEDAERAGALLADLSPPARFPLVIRALAIADLLLSAVILVAMLPGWIADLWRVFAR